jgi:hypothetical protein
MGMIIISFLAAGIMMAEGAAVLSTALNGR